MLNRYKNKLRSEILKEVYTKQRNERIERETRKKRLNLLNYLVI